MFAKEGANLALSSLSSPDELESVAKECRGLGAKVFTQLADISDSAQCVDLANNSLAALDKVDVLVSNAAIRPHHDLLSVSDEDWHKVFAINLHSTFYLSKALIPNMQELQSGSIIAIGGMAAITGRPSTAAVTAAKTGLWGFIRAVAAEFACDNVRANMVNPGTIDTTRRHPEWAPHNLQQGQATPRNLDSIPLGRLGTVSDIANACLYLASEESSYITGDQINVVGGRYMVASEWQ
jgi:3-oxoacyl-[acyl-carrier protein] reductase